MGEERNRSWKLMFEFAILGKRGEEGREGGREPCFDKIKNKPSFLSNNFLFD